MESGFLHCEAIPLCRRLQTLKHLGMGFDGLGHFWGVVFCCRFCLVLVVVVVFPVRATLN